MSLIKCPDCGIDVSDQATVCPKCSRPIATTEQKSLDSVQTIEKTSKSLKLQLALSIILVVAGFGIIAKNPSLWELGLLMAVIGSISYVSGRLRVWWRHE